MVAVCEADSRIGLASPLVREEDDHNVVQFACGLFDLATLPGIPVSSDGKHESDRKKEDNDGSDVAEPGPATSVAGRWMVTVFVRALCCFGGHEEVLLFAARKPIRFVNRESRVSLGWRVVKVRNS